MHRPLRRALRWLLVLALVAPLAPCAVNPATGERQLMLIGEGREIEMGQQGAEQVRSQIGIVQNQALQDYVSEIGLDMARDTERPDLPWSFQVADDPVINAFALPGGPVFVTRGILAYFNSEAELATVLGHEAGHITGRHSAEQMSRQQLYGGLAGIGAAVFDAGALTQALLGTGLNVLFLQYGRDDERQADRLGIRYMTSHGYDPSEAIDVFEMLDRQSEASGGSGLPSWLSTHPSPEDRIDRIRAILDTLPADRRGGTVGRDRYLAAIDGMVFGPNPRNGFFRNGTFLHPDLAFRLDFPGDWQRRNLAQAVVAQSPGEDAILQLTLSEADSHGAAAREFFGQEGLRATADVGTTRIHGIPATTGVFVAATEQGEVQGRATFVEYEGRVFQLLGYTPRTQYSTWQATFRDSHESFQRLEDPEALGVEPMRLRIITTDRAGTVAELLERRPAPVDASTLAILNAVQEGERIPADTRLKWVEGERPPGS